MNVYMLETNKRIDPFGDHPRDCLVGNRRLGDIQKEVLQSFGLTLKVISNNQQMDDSNEHVIFDDSLLFSKELLQEFIKQSRKLKCPTICAVKPLDPIAVPWRELATQEVRVYPDRIEYGLRYVPALALRGEPVPLLIDVEQHFVSMPNDEYMFGCHETSVPLTDMILFQIDHWVNLHDANMAVLAAVPARLLNSKARMFSAALKARSANQWKILHHYNKIGKNCNIHPTAWIEYSTLGDNVTVGAGSVISGSLVGDYNSIHNGVTMQSSVTGNQCTIGAGATIMASVLYPGTFTIARLVNNALCGRASFLGDGVTLSDYRIDGKNVNVLKDGRPVDTGSRVLGACLGHGVYLAAGCIVGPGRAIPSGQRIAPERSRYISSWGADGNIPGHQSISVSSAPQAVAEKIESKTRSSLIRRILRFPAVD